jgi:outer membrane protein OmpA-like peptidoglycan-associated protein
MKLASLVVVLGAALGCSGHAKIVLKTPVAKEEPPPPPPPKKEEPPPPPPPATHGAELDVPGEIEFDVDKATFKKDGNTDQTLASILKILTDNPSITKVRIEGHTDSDGGDKRNQPLSEKRAKTVYDWLVKNGVDAKRLVAIGCAAKDPLVDNDSAEHKAKNRRTEFDIEEIDGKKPDDYTEPCKPNPKRGK